MQSTKHYCFRLRSCQEMLYVLILQWAGFYLGFVISGRSGRGPDLPRGVGGVPPGHFLKWICAEKQSGAFCMILRHNFEKWYSAVCTDLVESGWFFRYTVVTYTVYGKDIKQYFLWGSWAFFLGGGGSFYPSNTLDRTLVSTAYSIADHYYILFWDPVLLLCYYVKLVLSFKTRSVSNYIQSEVLFN